jgi:hypothetical protein
MCCRIGLPAVTRPPRMSAFPKYSASPSSIQSGGATPVRRSRSCTSSCMAVCSMCPAREPSMNIVPPAS